MQRRFEIGHCLGKGGFGEVYRAVVHGSGGMEHEVAIKLLHPDLLHNETARDRMRDEGRLLSRLNHPAIVTCYALTVLAGRIALVTEFVHGADLSVCCTMNSPIPPRALLQVLGKVSAALDIALNETTPGGDPMELIHRDIKPGNIRVGHHGQAFLLDFGIARSDTIERNVHTAADLVVGSLLYMAPERFGPSGASGASDVFGLGCCLYEGLVGKPFYGASSLRDISRLANEPEHYQRFLEQRIGELSDTVPAALRDLCMDCLRHDAHKRPTAAILGMECERLADQLGGVPLRTWARAQAWSENPGTSGTLTGQVLEESPLPAPGQTLQALLPELQITDGRSETTSFVAGVVESEATWTDADGIMSGQEEIDPRHAGISRASLPRQVASVMSILAMIVVLSGMFAFGLALNERWSEPDEVVMTPTSLVLVPEKVSEVPTLIPLEKEDEPAVPVRRTPQKVKKSVNKSEPKTVVNNEEEPAVIRTLTPKRSVPSRVVNGGPFLVELRGKGKTYVLPNEVPYGMYQIWADVGHGLERRNMLNLSPGDVAKVICSDEKPACDYTID